MLQSIKPYSYMCLQKFLSLRMWSLYLYDCLQILRLNLKIECNITLFIPYLQNNFFQNDFVVENAW